MPFDVDIVATIAPATDVDPSRLRAAALAALAVGGDDTLSTEAALTIAIVADDAIRALNARYRGIDEPTDVLAFGGQPADFVLPPGAPPHLGDVVIALPVAAAQAQAAGHAVDDELALLVVHGVLHLLGYDHETAADAERMQAREAEALARLREMPDGEGAE